MAPTKPECRQADQALRLANLCASLAMLSRGGRPGQAESLALGLYRAGWYRLLGGQPPSTALLATLAEALTAIRLGDLDAERLAALGVAGEAALRARQRAFAAALAAVDLALRPALRLHFNPPRPAPLDLPAVVADLAVRPPAAPPGETLADRALRLALLGAVLADGAGADPAMLFLAGLEQDLPPDRDALPGPLAAALVAAARAVAEPGSPAARAFALALAGGPGLAPALPPAGFARRA